MPPARAAFDTHAWVAHATASAAPHGRCPSRRQLRFLALAPNSPADMDRRRERNERVGAGAWFRFEADHAAAVLRLVQQLVAGLPRALRRECAVYLCGNHATRLALADEVTTFEQCAAVMRAFPPSIVNVSVAVTHARHAGAVSAAVDAAVVALKRHMDARLVGEGARVNSCVIVPSAARGGGSVMVDVPCLGRKGTALAATAYSVCRNTSHDRFMLTRLRRSAPDGAGGLAHVPLVDVTVHDDAPPPLVAAPLADGFVWVQHPATLERHFTELLDDAEVAESPAKMDRVAAALWALDELRRPAPPRGEPMPGEEPAPSPPP